MQKSNLAIYPVILTSRLVSNAYLKGTIIWWKYKWSSRFKTFRFRFDSLFPFVIPAEAPWYLKKTWYLRNLLPESGVPNRKKNAISSRVSSRGQKTFNLYKNGMFSYMVGIEWCGKLFCRLFKLWNCSKEQQMVRNDSLFVTIFHCFGPLFELPT